MVHMKINIALVLGLAAWVQSCSAWNLRSIFNQPDDRHLTSCSSDADCGRRVCDDGKCGACQAGYVEENRYCDDIDECATGDNSCDANAACSNAFPPTRYTCACMDGYTGNGFSCSDINECSGDNPCPANSSCSNTDGGFECACDSGFVDAADGDGIVDVDGTCVLPPQADTQVTTPRTTPITPRSFTLGGCPSGDIEEVYLTEQFEGADVGGWSNGKLSSSLADSSYAGLGNFMGPFFQNDPYPSKLYQFPTMNVESIAYCFEFLAIDSWDCSGREGEDKMMMEVIGEGGMSEMTDFGPFCHQNGDSTPPTTGTSVNGMMSYRISSLDSRAAGGDFWRDRVHAICVNIPRPFFVSTNDITVTFLWKLAGAADEAVGIDNIKITFCLATSPSSSPSESPTGAPAEPAPGLVNPPPPVQDTEETDAPTPIIPTPSPSSAPTISRSPTPQPTFGTPTASPAPTSPSAGPTESPAPSPSPSLAPTSPSAGPTESPAPSQTPINKPTPKPTPFPSATPTISRSPTPQPIPTYSPAPTPVPSDSPSTQFPSTVPTESPAPSPSPTGVVPTASPSVSPQPSISPTWSPAPSPSP